MKFDKNFFSPQRFSAGDLAKLKAAAGHELEIARSSPHPEVRFHFSYMALVKIGIHQIAAHGFRVKARPGHHQKIIEMLGKILDSEDIAMIGDKMRRDRNADIYDAQGRYSEEEIEEYMDLIQSAYQKI